MGGGSECLEGRGWDEHVHVPGENQQHMGNKRQTLPQVKTTFSP